MTDRETLLRERFLRPFVARLLKRPYGFDVRDLDRAEVRAARLAAHAVGREPTKSEIRYWRSKAGEHAGGANAAATTAWGPFAPAWEAQPRRRMRPRADGPESLGLFVSGLAVPWARESAPDDLGEILHFARFVVAADVPIPLLIDHDPARVAGAVVRLDAREHGLDFIASLHETDAAMDAAGIIGEGGGASCDFDIGEEASERRGQNVVRRVLQSGIREVSITSSPRFAETLGTLRLVG